jgi:hypothetical protein
MKKITSLYVGVFILDNGFVLTSEFETQESFNRVCAESLFSHAYLLPMNKGDNSIDKVIKGDNPEVVVHPPQVQLIFEAEIPVVDEIENDDENDDDDEDEDEDEDDISVPITWNRAFDLPYRAFAMDRGGNMRGFSSTVLAVDATGNVVVVGAPLETRYGTLVDVEEMNRANPGLHLCYPAGRFTSPAASMVMVP